MPRLDIDTRRTQLIDAAIRIALRDGLDNTTVRRIATEAGVSLGTVHYCFDNKRALLEAVVETLLQREVDVAEFDLPDGATVAIPNDPTNAARALRLLEANDLLTLADTGDAAPTALDVQDNPKDLEIQEVEAAQLPRSLADVDAAVINGNYAIDADLNPAEDALLLEEAEGNPNANLVVVRSGDEDDERIGLLEELLHSDEVRQFIEDTYSGAVLPAF